MAVRVAPRRDARSIQESATHARPGLSRNPTMGYDAGTLGRRTTPRPTRQPNTR